jgi:hypothetical protein
MLAFRGYPLINMYSPGAKILLLVLVVWSLIWKGIALWKAVRNNSKPWFIVLLLVNTVGILEILYIYWLSKKQTVK